MCNLKPPVCELKQTDTEAQNTKKKEKNPNQPMLILSL